MRKYTDCTLKPSLDDLCLATILNNFDICCHNIHVRRRRTSKTFPSVKAREGMEAAEGHENDENGGSDLKRPTYEYREGREWR